MIAAFLSKNIFKSFRDRELEENEELQTFPFDWALELVEQPVLLTIFWDQQHEEFEKKNLEACKEQENEKQEELQTVLWEQELVELLAHKSCPLDLLHDHLGQALLWKSQLRQNLSENEKNKKLDDNKELDKKSFQSLIFLQLVALLLEKHFASAASSQLLGYEAWGKYREASEDSFDKVGDKELLQDELRRDELGCKDLRPAFFWALCPDSFEETSFTEETFANTSLGKGQLQREQLDNKQLHRQQLDTEQLDREQLLREHLLKEQASQRTTLTRRALHRRPLTSSAWTRRALTRRALTRAALARAALARAAWKRAA